MQKFCFPVCLFVFGGKADGAWLLPGSCLATYVCATVVVSRFPRIGIGSTGLESAEKDIATSSITFALELRKVDLRSR